MIDYDNDYELVPKFYDIFFNRLRQLFQSFLHFQMTSSKVKYMFWHLSQNHKKMLNQSFQILKL